MIYIDLGAYDGDTVDQFVNWGQVLGDISNAKIYAFEPNTKHSESRKDTKERQQKHVKEINFIDKAAWVNDGTIKFSSKDMGSTVMPDKKNAWNESLLDEVECFDFSEWLKQFEGEEVYIKMDIEGAEYPVLEKMIKDGTDKLVKLLMVEWHGNKMGSKWLKKQAWIIDNLKCKWIDWR